MRELDTSILGSARAYALSRPYEEAAGLILNFNEPHFYPMENISSQKTFRFSLDKRVYLIRDKICSIFHSHPLSDAYPSDADVRVSRGIGLPFLIYSCLYDNFLFFDTRKCNVVRE